jgi:RHS repeat-associated protein
VRTLIHTALVLTFLSTDAALLGQVSSYQQTASNTTLPSNSAVGEWFSATALPQGAQIIEIKMIATGSTVFFNGGIKVGTDCSNDTIVNTAGNVFPDCTSFHDAGGALAADGTTFDTGTLATPITITGQTKIGMVAPFGGALLGVAAFPFGSGQTGSHYTCSTVTGSGVPNNFQCVNSGQAYFVIKTVPAGTTFGTISVTPNIPGAPFSIAGPLALLGAGNSTFPNVPTGVYTIAYGGIGCHQTSIGQSQTVLTGGTTAFIGGYGSSWCTLFNQTDATATSTGSHYSDNWYQLGNGYSGVLNSLTLSCSTGGGILPATGTITLSEYTDAAYSSQSNSYALTGTNGNPNCTATAATLTLTGFQIPISPARYYRLETAADIQNASVFLKGTTTQGTAMYDGFQSGVGRVENHYTFYPFLIANGGANEQLGNKVTAGLVSEPINTATGNYYHSRTDLVVPGKGLTFALTRTYNALESYSGPLGAGWTHSYNLFLTVDAVSGAIALKEADGHFSAFIPTGSGLYSPAVAGVYDTLQANQDGSFTVTRKSQLQLAFSADGKLSAIIDRNGNQQVLVYNGSGQLASITDSSNRTYTFTNDASHLISVRDPLGRVWEYAYDGGNNLTSVQNPLGGITRYTYDGSHHMLTALDARGTTFLTNTYDASGRVVTQKNGRGYATTLQYDTPTAGTTTVTDPRGNSTQYVHDGSLRLSQTINPLAGTTSYTYDANNNVATVQDANGKTTSSGYDSRGNRTAAVNPLGDSQTFTFDVKNSVLTSRTPKGGVTTFSYDAKGNPLTVQDSAGKTTAFTYDATGLVTSQTDPRGNTVTFVYDASGNLTSFIDPMSNTSTFTYDIVGRRLAATDANRHTGTTTYDPLSRITKTTDGLGHSTQYGYDAIGNILTTTDPNTRAVSYQFDADNNLTAVTDASGGVARFAYDANNNRVSATNAKGSVTTYAYDKLNRLTKLTDPLGSAKTYAYDAVGNTIGTTDANGTTNSYTYDALTRLISGSLGDGSSHGYTYDKNGNRITMTDSRGATTYVYDTADRVLSVTSPDNAVVRYSYDDNGNRASLGYPDGRTVQYQYDPMNRLLNAIDWAGKRTRYAYDAVGNLASVDHPNGATSSYVYDSANHLLQVVNRSGAQVLSSFLYSLDPSGNRLQVTSAASGTTRYSYDALDRLTSWTAPSGQVTQYIYDAAGNRLNTSTATASTIYTYDAADRMLTAGATSYTYDHNGSQIARTSGAATSIYGYDGRGRLISASTGGINTQFRYDGDGRRVSQTIGTATYQYTHDPVSTLPVVIAEAGPDGSFDYVYGLSLISATHTAFQYFYQFDGLGSVVTLTDSSGAIKASYSYDPWGKLTTPLDALGNKNKFKYTAAPFDSSTGFYHLTTRQYDPGTGRFTAADTFPSVALTPESLQRFAYASNNPLRFTDRSGLSAMDASMSEGVRTNTVAGVARTNRWTMNPLPDVPVPSELPAQKVEDVMRTILSSPAPDVGFAAVGRAIAAFPVIGPYVGASIAVGGYTAKVTLLAADTVVGQEVIAYIQQHVAGSLGWGPVVLK